MQGLLLFIPGALVETLEIIKAGGGNISPEPFHRDSSEKRR